MLPECATGCAEGSSPIARSNCNDVFSREKGHLCSPERVGSPMRSEMAQVGFGVRLGPTMPNVLVSFFPATSYI